MTRAETKLVESIAAIHPDLQKDFDDLIRMYKPEIPPAMTVLNNFSCRLGSYSNDFSDEQISQVARIIEDALRDYSLRETVVLGFLEGIGNAVSFHPEGIRVIERLGPLSKGIATL